MNESFYDDFEKCEKSERKVIKIIACVATLIVLFGNIFFLSEISNSFHFIQSIFLYLVCIFFSLGSLYFWNMIAEDKDKAIHFALWMI